jgi:hypothetical protein
MADWPPIANFKLSSYVLLEKQSRFVRRVAPLSRKLAQAVTLRISAWVQTVQDNFGIVPYLKLCHDSFLPHPFQFILLATLPFDAVGMCSERMTLSLNEPCIHIQVWGCPLSLPFERAKHPFWKTLRHRCGCSMRNASLAVEAEPNL